LKAGRLETSGQWVNTGEWLGGGYHAWYSPDTRTLDPIDYLPTWPLGLPNPLGQEIKTAKTAANRKKYPMMTPPGPQLFLAPFGDGSLLYGYDNDLNPVIVNSSTDKSVMAAAVKKIKGYGSGPLSIEKIGRDTAPGTLLADCETTRLLVKNKKMQKEQLTYLSNARGEKITMRNLKKLEETLGKEINSLIK